MGLFNIVCGRLTCPRCGGEVDAEVETKLGYMSELAELKVGDRYPWASPAFPQAGARPNGGNAIGDGYSVCPGCNQDFFVNVVVESDIIQRLEVDRSRSGYIQNG